LVPIGVAPAGPPPGRLPGVQQLSWAGVDVAVLVREASPGEARPAPPQSGRGYVAPGPHEHPPARVTASRVEGRGASGPITTLGDPLPITGAPAMDRLGEAVHRFLAADGWAVPSDDRHRRAARLLQAWAVAGALTPDALVAAADRLRGWADGRWPGSVWRREWPLAYVVGAGDPEPAPGEEASPRPGPGTIVAGTADLIIEAAEGLVLVDHKTFACGIEEAVARAANYSGQLGAYCRALSRATGKPVVGTFIHLPVQGCVVPVSTNGPAHLLANGQA
ncbi:MAG: PD-(D/E)XK nuclease family protein, partial [Anaerolineae bacterium]